MDPLFVRSLFLLLGQEFGQPHDEWGRVDDLAAAVHRVRKLSKRASAGLPASSGHCPGCLFGILGCILAEYRHD